MLRIEKYFNENGYFKEPYNDYELDFDPYRNLEKWIEIGLFDEKGNIHEHLFQEIEYMMRSAKVDKNSDVVFIYYSQMFAKRTNDQYSLIYAWK